MKSILVSSIPIYTGVFYNLYHRIEYGGTLLKNCRLIFTEFHKLIFFFTSLCVYVGMLPIYFFRRLIQDTLTSTVISQVWRFR